MSAAPRARTALPFLLCTLIWGSTWIVITTQFGAVPAAWSITYRFALAGLAMFAISLWRGEPRRLGRAGHLQAIAVGVPQFTCNYLFVYAAEARIASGLVALISALILVSNAVLARVFLGQTISRRFVAGSAVTMAGLALLFAHEFDRHGGQSGRILLGVLLSLGGVLSASTSNIIQASERSHAFPAARLLATSMAYGAALDALVAWATAGPPVFRTDTTYLLGLFYLAIVGSAMTFTLYYALLRTMGPARASYIGVLTPVIAMLLSTLFEGYRWSATAAAGAGLAFAGLAVALSARRPSRQDG